MWPDFADLDFDLADSVFADSVPPVRQSACKQEERERKPQIAGRVSGRYGSACSPRTVSIAVMNGHTGHAHALVVVQFESGSPSAAKEAAESGRGCTKHTSGAKAQTYFQRLSGTTKVVPFPFLLEDGSRVVPYGASPVSTGVRCGWPHPFKTNSNRPAGHALCPSSRPLGSAIIFEWSSRPWRTSQNAADPAFLGGAIVGVG